MSIPYEGDSKTTGTPGLKGTNTAGGDAVVGQASGAGNGHGVFGTSANWEGVHGDTNSATAAGVVGIQLNPAGTGAGVFGGNDGKGHGVFGTSANWEGVHGETNSMVAAGVAGVQLNKTGTGAGVFGQNQGDGHGVFGTSANWEGVHGDTNSATAAGVVGIQLNPAGTGAGVFGGNDGKGHGVFGTSANWEGVHGETNSMVAAGVVGIQLNPLGTGAGVYAESRGKGPAGFFKGDVAVTGSLQVDVDIIMPAADCAEDFDVANSAELEPGTVVVLNDYGALLPGEQAYDQKVAGVISGAGSYRPAMILDKRESSQYRQPVALLGKVYCKVDAGYLSIRAGDLLTTSPTRGHAMKADDPQRAFGSVIGKALLGLETGKGLIPILVGLR